MMVLILPKLLLLSANSTRRFLLNCLVVLSTKPFIQKAVVWFVNILCLADVATIAVMIVLLYRLLIWRMIWLVRSTRTRSSLLERLRIDHILALIMLLLTTCLSKHL